MVWSMLELNWELGFSLNTWLFNQDMQIAVMFSNSWQLITIWLLHCGLQAWGIKLLLFFLIQLFMNVQIKLFLDKLIHVNIGFLSSLQEAWEAIVQHYCSFLMHIPPEEKTRWCDDTLLLTSVGLYHTNIGGVFKSNQIFFNLQVWNRMQTWRYYMQ